MKKNILALLFALASTFATSSYSRCTYIEVEDDEDDDIEIVYERPSYRRTYVSRHRPVVREVVYEPAYTEVRYVDANPGSSIVSGLVGFGLGTAIGAALSD